MNFRRLTFLVLVVCVVAGCSQPAQDLTQWCPGDPTRQWCPEGEGECSGPYECLSYCIVHHPEGENIPDTGMGSWCDDPRIPAFGDFCRDYLDAVAGCSDWCAAHADLCGVATDGDTDVDSDSDSDSDSDVETDADPDADPDPEPECLSDDECPLATASHCDTTTWSCTTCSDDAHCTHIDGAPACHDGECVLCSDANTTRCIGGTTHCLLDDHTCVACLTNDHCPTPAASRCDSTTHACAPCVGNDDCTHLTEDTHVCDGGNCVQCTSNADCDITAGLVCNYAENRCVNACQDCTSDTSCATDVGADFRCVMEWGSLQHCLQVPSEDHTDCERPWVRRNRTLSAGGEIEVCSPPENVSCMSIVEFGTTCSAATATLCGEDGTSVDGACIEGPNYCSYTCRQVATFHDEWCPEGTSCDESSGNCLRP
jgi:hypothetical protein